MAVICDVGELTAIEIGRGQHTHGRRNQPDLRMREETPAFLPVEEEPQPAVGRQRRQHAKAERAPRDRQPA